MGILHELNNLREVIDVISEQTKNPALLPQAGEQVLLDLKSTNNTWKYQVCRYLSVTTFLSQTMEACPYVFVYEITTPEVWDLDPMFWVSRI